MASSPWGQIQQTSSLARGFTEVSTAGHGGIRVSPTAALLLSPEARALGLRHGRDANLWYEEDEMAMVPLLELAILGVVVNQDIAGLIKGLSLRFPDYLRAIGQEPDAEIEARGRRMKEYDRRRAALDPDVIVGASNEDNGVTRVWTADRSRHLVAKEAYARAHRESDGLILLSVVRYYESDLLEMVAGV